MADEEDEEYRTWHLKCPACGKWVFRGDFERHRQKEMDRASRVKKFLEAAEDKSECNDNGN
jgi:uncharacterized protein (DUF2225 family)